MSAKIEWLNNDGPATNESTLEYLAIKNNQLICRIKREKVFSDFWVARDIKGDYLFRDQYRSDVFEWVEIAFKD